MEKRMAFDTMPQVYDRYRPSYPRLFVDELLQKAGIPAGGRLLEVGCGTGKLTIPLAERGYRLTCIDIGPNMVAYAREKLGKYGNAEVFQGAFEEWESEPESYDAVVSAQAWHWVDQPGGFQKASSLLRGPQGSLVIIRIYTSRPETPMHSKIQGIYAKYGMNGPQEPLSAMVQRESGSILGSGLFRAPECLTMDFDIGYSSDEYMGLLSTYSDHLCAPFKEDLMSEIRRVIDDHGGVLEKPQTLVGLVAHPMGIGRD